MASQTSMYPRQQENTAVMEEIYFTRSVTRCYKQNQLAAVTRGLRRFSRCEVLLLEAGS
jgi:hypothetical protein